MNPVGIIKNYLMQGITPQNILNKLNVNNPILNNVIGMAQNGNIDGVENFARNICKQKGLDFDTEFNKFMANIR